MIDTKFRIGDPVIVDVRDLPPGVVTRGADVLRIEITAEMVRYYVRFETGNVGGWVAESHLYLAPTPWDAVPSALRLLRTRRHEKGLTQEDTARRAGVPVEIVQAADRGELGVTLRQLADYAGALGLMPLMGEGAKGGTR